MAERPRPTLADDLLPERALAGDPLARSTLINRIYKPLQAHSTELLATLWCYLDTGRSLEATARELFVHPNTVRYRLKRVSDVIGWDATGRARRSSCRPRSSSAASPRRARRSPSSRVGSRPPQAPGGAVTPAACGIDTMSSRILCGMSTPMHPAVDGRMDG